MWDKYAILEQIGYIWGYVMEDTLRELQRILEEMARRIREMERRIEALETQDKGD